MATADRTNLRRLVLQLERDLLAEAHLRTLLTAAAITVAEHRREAANLKGRLKRI